MKKNILVVITILILSLSMLSILRMNIAKADNPWTLSDSKLALFRNDWGGTATVTVIGPGVQFAFSGLSTGGSGFDYKMDWGFGSTADWGGFPDGDGHYNNFTPYTCLKLLVNNTGTSTLTMCLYINTGFTSGGWGANDTFWQSDWTDVPAGQSKVLTLDFKSATAWNIADDPNPAYAHPNGWRGPIFRLDQVTNVGLQALRNPAGDGTGTIIVYGNSMTWLYIDPSPVQKAYSDVGNTFDVTVRIEAVTDLFGFDINITWNNALVTYYNNDTTLLNSIWPDGWSLVKNQTGTAGGTGWWKIVAVSTKNGFSSVNSHALFNLTFTVQNPLTNSMTGTILHFDTDKLSDSGSQSITHTTTDGTYSILGQEPTLDMLNSTGSNSRTCRMYNEIFNVAVDVYNAANVTDFEYEIHFNATQLNIQSIDHTAWGTGTETVDNINGVVIGSTSGTTKTGTVTLITITFKTTLLHKWKAIAGWQNLQTSTIYFQAANLSYPSSQPKLQYVNGGINQIVVNPAFAYTFSPIKGDVNNDGTVNVGDLAAIASKYDTYDSDYNLVGSDTLVDIFDLVVVASNFFFTYTSTP